MMRYLRLPCRTRTNALNLRPQEVSKPSPSTSFAAIAAPLEIAELNTLEALLDFIPSAIANYKLYDYCLTAPED